MDPNASILEKIFLAKGSDLDPVLIIPRTLIVFIVAIIFVRLANKRFIAQASAMDLVMAVVMGSLLSRAINGGATLLSSLVAGAVMVALQRLFAYWSCRSKWFETLVKGTHQVLVRQGVIDRDQMRRHNITDDELKFEMRLHALTEDLKQVRLAVLERSGEISVVKASETSGA